MRSQDAPAPGGDRQGVPARAGHAHEGHGEVALAHVHGAHDHAHDPRAHGERTGLVPDEGPMGTSDPGSVVLDIGGTAGALVVSTPPTLAGEEIEIRPQGAPWRGAHTAVRERRLPDRVAYAGVFPRLDAGGYELRLVGADEVDGLRIWVTAGIATEAWLDEPGR